MAEHDITQEILLRKIQADLTELKASSARMESGLARIENDIRELARVTIGLVGTVERIEQRLLALEARAPARE